MVLWASVCTVGVGVCLRLAQPCLISQVPTLLLWATADGLMVPELVASEVMARTGLRAVLGGPRLRKPSLLPLCTLRLVELPTQVM
jgi:hypothetical protein